MVLEIYRHSGGSNTLSDRNIGVSGFLPSANQDMNIIGVGLFVWSGGNWIKYNPWYATA